MSLAVALNTATTYAAFRTTLAHVSATSNLTHVYWQGENILM